MASKKLTTGLTGLVVARTPHFTLTTLYNKTLKTLSKMPEDAAYRRYTQQTVNERLNIVANEQDVTRVEEKIGCGQIEELIIQAENELILARKMLTYKPWESLINNGGKQWKWPI